MKSDMTGRRRIEKRVRAACAEVRRADERAVAARLALAGELSDGQAAGVTAKELAEMTGDVASFATVRLYIAQHRKRASTAAPLDSEQLTS